MQKELKEDILDLRILGDEEKSSISFEEYLRRRGVWKPTGQVRRILRSRIKHRKESYR